MVKTIKKISVERYSIERYRAQIKSNKDKVEKTLMEVYPQDFEGGYRFMTNAEKKDIPSDITRYRDAGYDVIVRKKAFDINSHEIKNYRSILVKKKE